MMSQQYKIVFCTRFENAREQEMLINEEFLPQQIEILVESGYKIKKAILIERQP